MKKEYEKPVATAVSFQVKEDLSIGGSTSAGEGDSDNGFHTLWGKEDFQLRP